MSLILPCCNGDSIKTQNMVAASDISNSSDVNDDDKSALSHTGKGWGGMPSSKCCNTMGKIGRIVMLPQYEIESVVMLEGKCTRRT